MGLFDWLRPSPEKKLARARRLNAEGQFAEARLLVAGLPGEEAQAVLAEARRGLVRLNLEGARRLCRAGDEPQVDLHLERARNFDPGDMGAEIQRTLVELDQLRRGLVHDRLWGELKTAAERRARLGNDPSDPAWVAKNTGSIQLADAGKDGLPRLAFYPEPAIFEPAGFLTAEGQPLTVEAAVERLKAIYPRDLTSKIDTVHGEAILQTVSSHPERAVGLLMPLRDQDAVACFELGRAACALGAYLAAELAFGRFAELAGGHRAVGEVHSAELEAQVAAHLGQRERALHILDEQRKKAPQTAPFWFAALAIEAGRLSDAAAVVTQLRRQQPNDRRLPPIVAALALRQAVVELARTHPVLRGVVPSDPEEEARQRGAVSDALAAALDKALQGLPKPKTEGQAAPS